MIPIKFFEIIFFYFMLIKDNLSFLIEGGETFNHS